MVEVALREIAKSSRSIESSQRQFRDAANENNRSITKFAKDIASMFASQRKQSTDISNSIAESLNSTQQSASKVDSTNSLLQESISLQSTMVAELKNIRTSIRSLASAISQAGGLGGGSTGQNLAGSAAAASGLRGLLRSGGGLAAGAAGLGIAAGAGYLDYSALRQSASDAAAAANTGGAGGSSGAKGVGQTGSASEAMSFFQSKGWTKEQAAGIVGNLQAESGSNLKTDSVGDGGKAYGIAQWHPPRQENFRKIFGKDIRESTFQEQLQFIQWELENTEKKAGEALKSATSASQAAAIVDKLYERSSGAHRDRRVANAEALVRPGAASQQDSRTDTSTSVTPRQSGMGAGASTSGVTPSTSTSTTAGAATSSQSTDATPVSTGETSDQGKSKQGHAQALERGVGVGLAKKLQEIESAFGGKLNVTSGARSEERNRSVGGAGNSAHLRGNAVDVTFNGGVQETLKLIEAASKAGIGGIGVYGPGSVHLDVESKRAWGPNYRRGSVPQWAESAIRAHETNKWGEYDASARGGENATRMGGGQMVGAGLGGMGGGMIDPMAMMGMMGGGKLGAIAGLVGAFAPALSGLIGGMGGGGGQGQAPQPQQPAVGGGGFDFKQFSMLPEDQQTSARFFEADRNEQLRRTQNIQQRAVESRAQEQTAQERMANPPPPPPRPEEFTNQNASSVVNNETRKDEPIESWQGKLMNMYYHRSTPSSMLA